MQAGMTRGMRLRQPRLMRGSGVPSTHIIAQVLRLALLDTQLA